ncbi:hypothetical protein Q4I32_003195 [Leishmania shawi]|uniref:FHA domain-containing protein n=1 Tax=Leishmania shawi TaxID=5680 RepID=A0AAW3BZD9_9TRYP
MRFQVQACFDTAAHALILSSEASENSAILVADDCAVELHVAPVGSDGAGATGILPTTPTLIALPWDSSRMRLCVNGISYGTGPLVLRDGDQLTLHPSHATEATTPFIYTVSAVPASANVDDKEMRDGASLATRASASEEKNRLRAVMSNVEQYAKWNNFYSHRFTNLATIHLPPGDGTRSVGHLHKCVCGLYVQTEVGPSDAMPRETHAPDDTQTHLVLNGDAEVSSVPSSVHARTLVTLLSSLPQLLEFESSSAQQQTTLHEPLPVMCCCCPFTSASSNPALRLCERKLSHTLASKTSAPMGANTDVQQVREARSSSCDVGLTPWSVYAHARRGGSVAAQHVSHVKEAIDARGTDAFVGEASLDRAASELLSRISFLESALMGLHYE